MAVKISYSNNPNLFWQILLLRPIVKDFETWVFWTPRVAFSHFAWIGPNKLVEINHNSLVQNICFLCQSVLLPYSSEGLKIFHFSQKFDTTRVIRVAELSWTKKGNFRGHFGWISVDTKGEFSWTPFRRIFVDIVWVNFRGHKRWILVDTF